ncbi:hypothetical protein [Thermoleptolyngbya sp.]
MSDLQVTLKTQQGIQDYEDTLVQKIEAAFEKKYGQLDPSQYQNLVQVALSTESPEVIKNFLRYQTGRDTKWGRGEGSLAEAIIQDIQGDLEDQASAIAEAAGDHSRKKAVHIELIRRYLGYGKRHLIYLRPKTENSRK